MSLPASKGIIQQWKENILKQRESGLSIVSWCKVNNITPRKFYYWQEKLFPKEPLCRSDFNEIGIKQKAIFGLFCDCIVDSSK